MSSSSATSLADLPTLGVGLGYRTGLHTGIFQQSGAIDFLEIVADHYFSPPREKSRELDLLADHFPLIPHALDLSLGSGEGIDGQYLELLGELVDRLNPPWWSEHLAFTKAAGVSIGHLAPIAWTWKSIDTIARNVERARRRIDVPLILENITYVVAMPGAEMSEPAFLHEIVRRTGCGLLLDITNLYVNAANHRFDAVGFLEELPLDAVVQLHFVGIEDQAGHLIDSHSSPTPPEIFALLDETIRRAPVKGCILERDGRLPSVGELCDELRQVRDMGKRHGRWR